MRILSTPFKKEIEFKVEELERIITLPIPMSRGLVYWLKENFKLDLFKTYEKQDEKTVR